MTSIWASDLHLNENPRDQYRWEILPWLEKEAAERDVDFVGVAGDITDAKDRHPASLVNRFVDFFGQSKKQWVILTGNHDHVDPNCPFFRFMDHFDNVKWIYEPERSMLPIDAKPRNVLLLPATKEWEKLWTPHLEYHYDYIFMHGTFAGTKTETGFEIPGGIPIEFFPEDSYENIFSGDIHIPGRVADHVEYIGAPYRVHFGDTYIPRVIWFNPDGNQNLRPPLKSRHVIVVRGIHDLDKFRDVSAGDQVKVRVRLKRSEFPEWRKIRSEIEAEAHSLGWEVAGIELTPSPVRRRLPGDAQATSNGKKTPEEFVREYAKGQGYKEPMVKFGLELLKG